MKSEDFETATMLSEPMVNRVQIDPGDGDRFHASENGGGRISGNFKMVPGTEEFRCVKCVFEKKGWYLFIEEQLYVRGGIAKKKKTI